MRTHAEHSRTFTGAHNAPQAAHSAMNVSEALKSEVSAYCRSGALDPFPCTIIAMEQVASRFRLTFRQVERLFVELA
jgi:hypothetical protein